MNPIRRKNVRHPVSVGSILDSVMRSAGLKSAMDRDKALMRWPQIVGEAMSRHAVAERLSGSTLHVRVSSSVFANELAALKEVILEKLNRALPSGAKPIEEIRFHQGTLRIKDAIEEAVPEPPPQLSAEEMGQIDLTLQHIKDEELRTIVEKILKKDLLLKHRRDP